MSQTNFESKNKEEENNSSKQVTKEDKYYVTMTDSFLSGWGMAEGKTNKLVIECDTLAEAQIVKRNAKDRSEMKYVRISYKKPSYNQSMYLTHYEDKTNFSRWFIPNQFRRFE
jgi:hypothetical protein